MNKIICLFLITFFISFSVHAKDVISVAEFSSLNVKDENFQGFEPLTFKKIDKHTKYSLVKLDNKTVVHAKTDNSASGLIKKIKIDLKEYPVIKWSFRADNIYKNGDVRKKSGDDYPARIYIAFEYDPDYLSFYERIKFNTVKAIYGEYPPVASINYIWANKAKKETIIENPFVDRVKMIVVESGAENLGKFITFERNLYKDYLKAFNEEPPLISGVAIMSDSDNTHESAQAYYGDIVFKKSKE
ncbi:MAG: DUF3047 domain-containing protein [Thermodesulfobacteriota bacterium]